MKKQKQRAIKYGVTAIVFCAVFVLAGVIKIKASSSENVLGWIWGGSQDAAGNFSGLGWISTNNSNSEITPSGSISYGINIPATDGPVTGYAWSENVGWIDMNPAGSYPVAPNSSVARNGNNLTGWARIVSIKTALADSNSGGWQGWVKMNGSNTSPIQWECGNDSSCNSADENSCSFCCLDWGDSCSSTGGNTISYGVTIDPTTKKLAGYAWSDELGYISFSGTSPVNYGAGVGAAPPTCSGSGFVCTKNITCTAATCGANNYSTCIDSTNCSVDPSNCGATCVPTFSTCPACPVGSGLWREVAP